MDKRKLILLIDDEVDLVDMVKFQLKATGYEVVTAHNGLEGLEQLKTIKPDLIILDVNMPKMGGLEFCSKITTAHGRTQYPVLILTARANLEKTFKDVNVDGFMPKPFEIDILVKEVERILTGSVNPLIYLVDFKDKPNVQQITQAFLKERYEVVHAEDFETLLTQVQSRRPNFIILEYMQKGISGEEFVKKIKAEPLFKDIPVIVYSYSGFAQYQEKSLKAGADQYLGKPESVEAFVAAVRAQELKKKTTG